MYQTFSLSLSVSRFFKQLIKERKKVDWILAILTHYPSLTCHQT